MSELRTVTVPTLCAELERDPAVLRARALRGELLDSLSPEGRRRFEAAERREMARVLNGDRPCA